ncbi:protein kinase C-binding protein 1 isoform X1 [Ooceraea biroi]|uniref:Protein kinase C-binding protein n=1 Tax=Ooceraea biroi TaxID=2015173 RepID=A0A026WNE9_OOCBI|nr:protein kinase C-binding protein 1 isoform X1 [Ooceraea biroi]XP_011334487.1 protein kinase C-binding protein 1 isoform X1 [Ooceraea biroi]EZA57171.1 Protein kinase C-binding protein [Ooceraea biroi]
MTKMASHEDNKDSVKSSTADKIDTIAQSKTEEKSAVVSLIDENNKLNNAIKEEPINLTDENTSVQRDDANDVQSENKSDLKSQKIDKGVKKEAQDDASSLHTENSSEENVKNEQSKDSSTKAESILKRKQKSLSASTESLEDTGTRSKRKKSKNASDRFCWRCHKQGVNAHCTACPRSWHRKCIGGMPPSLEKWICGECVTILKAENAETRSTAMAQLSVDQLCMLLKHVVEILRDYPGSEPFCKPVDLVEVSTYLDYVIKPMDLSLLESNVRSKLYGSTDAFMADAKWIQHNCIVFNTCGGVYTDTLKLTTAAKQIIKMARQEVSEIEACPDCYAHGRNLPRPQPSWFIEPCRRPHPLVWAKLKGFPFWPAKAMPRLNSQGYVDVRFFGEHDRAWVSPKDLYLYSEEPPAPSPRKRKSDMDECVREITRHCRKLALMFGQFKFAPPKVQYNPNDPTQIKLLLPNYDPLEPNKHYPAGELSTASKKKISRKRTLSKSARSKSQSDESIDKAEVVDASSDKNEKESGATASKVQKLGNVKDISNSQAKLGDNDSKLSKNQVEDVTKVAQTKTVKSDKSKNTKLTLRSNVSSTGNVTGNSSTTGPNSGVNKDTLKDRKEESPVENSTPVTSAGEQSTRTHKKTLLKNIINPKLALSQLENASKTAVKNQKNNNKVYKPKTRLVDKMNAEKALKSISASKENEKQLPSNSGGVVHKVSLLNSNRESTNAQKAIPEIDITLSPPSSTSSAKVQPAVADKSVFLLVVNNGKTELVKQSTPVNYQGSQSALPVKESHQNSLLRKENKAKKTFRNKPNPEIVQCPLSDSGESTEISPTKKNTSLSYELLPPEAGPISARLHHNANELAKKMAQLMEEAYKEAANVNGEKGTADNHQATIFFLRMQIEHMKWQHQQQLAELKHNSDRTLREMRASLEAEKLRSIEETRREAEEEKLRCIAETKRKQWCARCGEEARFFCCWNTAYCDYPCQQSHWPTHMRTCSQPPAYRVSNSGGNSNREESNNAVTHDSAGKVHTRPLSKLSGIPPS